MRTSIEAEHFFYYDTPSKITASMLAESLLGLEQVVKRSGAVINQLYGIKVKDTEVLITAIEFSSYKENFLFRFVFGTGRKAERNVEKLREQLGIQNMDMKKFCGILVFGAVCFAAWKFIPSKESPAAIHIENSFNNMGRELGLSKEEMIALYEAAIKNPDELKKQVSRMAHPNGVAHSGTMIFNDDDTMTIPATVVDAIPVGYKRDEPEEPVKDFDEIDIVVRAIDLDRPTVGWAGIVPEISDRRLPIVIEDGLDPAKIPAGKLTKASITVVYRVDKFGNKEPKKYLLRKIIRDQ